MKIIQPYIHYIIEGIDNIGKSSLIDGLMNKYGYFQKIHFERPKKLVAYFEDALPLMTYQLRSFIYAMQLLEQTHVPFILDRSWIGEAVYSDRYRGYNGDYVFGVERDYDVDRFIHVKPILLVTSNFDVIEDDGLSFDHNAKEAEQEDFIQAFKTSILPHKQIIDICWKNGKRKPLDELLEEIS